MTQKELAGLPKEDLIEIILQLYVENEQLKARLAELEKQQQRPAKTPQNSSVPPAAGRKANRKKAKRPRSKGKRGAKAGHKGQTSENPFSYGRGSDKAFADRAGP